VARTPIVPLHHATKRELWTTYQPKVLGHMEPIFCTLELVTIPIIPHIMHQIGNWPCDVKWPHCKLNTCNTN
jgi:hypothetical protein